MQSRLPDRFPFVIGPELVILSLLRVAVIQHSAGIYRNRLRPGLLPLPVQAQT